VQRPLHVKQGHNEADREQMTRLDCRYAISYMTANKTAAPQF